MKKPENERAQPAVPAGTAPNGNTSMAGDNGNVQTGRITLGFEDLPYFRDYLKAVLRPKVERTLETMEKVLTEAAWRHIISSIAADQAGAPEVATALLRPLLENKLGFKFEVKFQSQFGVEAGATVEAPGGIDLESESGVVRVGGQDVMARRRPMPANPLVNAVMSTSGTRLTGR